VNLKIPPLALTCIFIVLMSILTWCFPQFTLSIPSNIIASILLAFVATFISVMGVVSFRNAKTTVSPSKPDQASSLVVKGIYKISRNPMYLGFLLFLIAWGIFLSHLLSLFIFPAIFFMYMNKYQIPAEEEALHKKFGEHFLNYRKVVRRWL